MSDDQKHAGAAESAPSDKRPWLAILLAIIPVVGTVVVASMKHCAPEHRFEGKERAGAAFAQLDRAFSRYISAADDFGSTFTRRGRAAFTSEVAQQEIDSRGTQLSAAFHELDEDAPRYIRDLQAALPERVTLIQDATDLLNYVLRALHQNGVRRLNNVIDTINDTGGKQVRSKLIADNMAQVDTSAQIIQKESVRVTERLNTLRLAYGTAIAEAEGRRK